MKKFALVVGLVVMLLSSVALLCADTHATKEETRKDVVYVCNCGPECMCNTVAVDPGKCKCGTDLKWAHVVKIEGNEALRCQCGEGCSCKIDPKDSTKCVCGNPVKRISLKGTGLYFCNCGGSCTCNVVCGEPGQCVCGMELKKVD